MRFDLFDHTDHEGHSSFLSTATISRPYEQTTLRTIADKPQLARLTPVVLTLLAILIHGYHPYSEDGGIYLAGIKYLLRPDLYPQFTGFVTAHLHLSVFPAMVATLVRVTGASLMTTMFALHALSIYLTLRATAAIVEQLGYGIREVRTALCLMATILTVPVAGTSLILMDPYVTARSFATPLSLFAVAAALHLGKAAWRAEPLPMRSAVVCVALSVTATLLHPLMGGYGVVCVICMGLFCLRRTKAQIAAVVASIAIATGTAAFVFAHPGHVATGYDVVARTRTYWFLDDWAWYEWIGAVAPLAILAWFSVRSRSAPEKLLARGMMLAGALGLIVSLLFVHPYAMSYSVARLQPLRIYSMVYLSMFVLLGCRLASRRMVPLLASAVLVAAATGMFAAQRSVYPHTRHIELPWAGSGNDWENAFLWLHDHAATTDLIGLDEHYVSAEGEDTQNARAISERSTLPDYSKDGGIAAIQPALASDWMEAQHLLPLRDAGEAAMTKLRNRGVDWVVLPAATYASMPCPYRNATVQVCRLLEQ